ncbi:hypothetical protein [Frankia sp. Cas4]|uniref:hypothetical protein n=1 Tax=Frankia sp. Cas4 TaxID=3073927 RepID=UPI002AD3A512|nr:hypothetical protein [Frankia sp. Cas4]
MPTGGVDEHRRPAVGVRDPPAGDRVAVVPGPAPAVVINPEDPYRWERPAH